MGKKDEEPALLKELREADASTAEAIFQEEDIYKWPPFGCGLSGFVPKELRDGKFAENAVEGVFLGWDRSVTNGTYCGVLKSAYEVQEFPLQDVITVTAGRFYENRYPLIRWSKVGKKGRSWI